MQKSENEPAKMDNRALRLDYLPRAWLVPNRSSKNTWAACRISYLCWLADTNMACQPLPWGYKYFGDYMRLIAGLPSYRLLLQMQVCFVLTGGLRQVQFREILDSLRKLLHLRGPLPLHAWFHCLQKKTEKDCADERAATGDYFRWHTS